MSQVGVPRLFPFLLHPQTLIMCYFRCWLSRPEAFEGVRLPNEALWRRDVMWHEGATAESFFARWQPLIRQILKPHWGLCSRCISNSLLSPLLSAAGRVCDVWFQMGQNGPRKIGKPKRTRRVCCVLTLFQRCNVWCHCTADQTGTKWVPGHDQHPSEKWMLILHSSAWTPGGSFMWSCDQRHSVLTGCLNSAFLCCLRLPAEQTDKQSVSW